jgi:hypothetical protein
MEPFIRFMLLCEDVRPRRNAPHKLDVFGLFTSLRPARGRFPLTISFCVYLLLTEGRGEGVGRIYVLDADTDEEVYAGSPHVIQFSGDPIEVVGIPGRVPSVSPVCIR